MWATVKDLHAQRGGQALDAEEKTSDEKCQIYVYTHAMSVTTKYNCDELKNISRRDST